MKIVFKNLEEKELSNFKGGEKAFKVRMHEGNYNKIMKGILVPGASIGMHTHETNSEVVFVLSGKGTMIFDDTKEILNAGDCHYCPMGHSHSFINESDEDLVFYAVVPEHE